MGQVLLPIGAVRVASGRIRPPDAARSSPRGRRASPVGVLIAATIGAASMGMAGHCETGVGEARSAGGGI